MKKLLICALAAAMLVLPSCTDNTQHPDKESHETSPSTDEVKAPVEEQLTDVQDAEQKLQSKVDILAQAMAENGNFTEDSIRSVKEKKLDINTLYDFRDMNEEQMKGYIDRLSQVNRYQRGIGLGYLRIRAEILGKMSADGPRLSVEALEELINQSHSRKELYNKIRAQYGEADFVNPMSGYSGGMIEYWLNDEGTDWFLMDVTSMEGIVRQIGLGHYDSDNGVTGELLYSSDDLKALYSAAE